MKQVLKALRRHMAPWADRLPRRASAPAHFPQRGALRVGTDPFDLDVELLVEPGGSLEGLPSGVVADRSAP